MEFDFSQGKVTLVVCPVDMRCGFSKLAQIAETYLHINIHSGNDWVVFISKKRGTAKVIHCDGLGNVMITRKLNETKFQQLMSKAIGAPTKSITKKEFESYLDGTPLEVKRESMVMN